MYHTRVEKTQSELERTFLKDAITVGLILESQYKIGPIHADFAIPSKKIAIEIDSKQWHSTPEAHEKDKERDDIYHSHGWSVLRILGSGVMREGEGIADDIKRGHYDDAYLAVILGARKDPEHEEENDLFYSE